ncbi:retrovirus-related Pol polyprotein from transposon 297 [Caerostris darwini]|uniref:Retrovirus-related Pol polyprotein from transposon 297 n=1 Tax=Caerostris darwini TaxID=1538125 RepID=A0AAV4WSK5_9ARAC|nr:retrovirus-related Pol polyprotein from transposon 297 [Caerostris darwini]
MSQIAMRSKAFHEKSSWRDNYSRFDEASGFQHTSNAQGTFRSGEPILFIEHRINTRDSPPGSVPHYRLLPAKKELLKKELDKFLEQNFIEVCKSPYTAPVVLVPEENGKIRLCIDYRGLNTPIVSDSYPLTRMDNLLHEEKYTPFRKIIDLQSGYHQVHLCTSYRDKTAFVCPFGTFRYLRMPFGLKTAPATFQIPIKKFRSSLKYILVLSYLDDLILLSKIFEKHMDDVKMMLRNRTDSSNYALRYVLLQGIGGEEHPVKYVSQVLTAIERNYSTTEREALFIPWAFNKIRGYIEDQEITVT